MDKNTMIKSLEERASQLIAIFERSLKCYDEATNTPMKLIALSQELRAVYRQIFEMKYCYLTSYEENEDA